jgi:ubiquinone/menaquinone biosynthesis C-methylase UbiE
MKRKKIDWNKVYTSVKSIKSDFGQEDIEIFYCEDLPLINKIISLVAEGDKVLEAGFGLARTSFTLVSKFNINITAIDIDEKLYKNACKNKALLGLGESPNFILGDIFDLKNYFTKNKKTFRISFSGGVLEHFSNNEIKRLLKEQLSVAEYVVFTVPIYSLRNLEYFNDSVYRRLLSVDEWYGILESFNIESVDLIYTRHDDIMVVLGQDVKNNNTILPKQ